MQSLLFELFLCNYLLLNIWEFFYKLLKKPLSRSTAHLFKYFLVYKTLDCFRSWIFIAQAQNNQQPLLFKKTLYSKLKTNILTRIVFFTKTEDECYRKREGKSQSYLKKDKQKASLGDWYTEWRLKFAATAN